MILRSHAIGACCAALITPTLLAQTKLVTIPGSRGVQGLGDVDNDGMTDYAVVRDRALDVYSRRTRSLLFSKTSDPRSLASWPRVRSMDVDKDGFADVLVGWPYEFGQGSNNFDGVVRVYSGKTGNELYAVWAYWQQDRFGWSIDVVGDIDMDGVDDFVVGAPEAPGGIAMHGTVTVHSGATGLLLRFATGQESIEKLGWTVAGLGDVDGDGVPDYAASAQQRGFTRVYSGRTGLQIRVLVDNAYETVMTSLGDVNADGVSDLVTATYKDARVISGKSGAVLMTFKPRTLNDSYGAQVLGPGDLDGDRIPDLVVGAAGSNSIPGYAIAHSGKDGSLLFVIEGYPAGQNWASLLLDAGDYNGDEVRDISFGTTGPNQVHVYSGASARALSVDTASLSTSLGGAQVFQLNAGVQHQRKLYVLLGSLTGTAPGLRIGTVTLPLNADPYFDFTLSNPNTLTASSLGILGSNGEATAQLRLPAGTFTSLAGRRLHHAFLVMNLIPFSIDDASNAAFLNLEK